MQRADPLGPLRRFRRIELVAAQRDLAEALDAGCRAVQREADLAAAQALEAEHAAASDYAAWLPAANGAQVQASALRERSQAALAAARNAVAAARLAERSVETERARHTALKRKAELSRAQTALDELTASVRHPRV